MGQTRRVRDEEHSRTALLVAALRARGPSGDHWAEALVGPEGVELADRLLQDHPMMTAWLAVRTRAIDEHVRDFGGNQIVILGAGLDTRAARLAEPGRRFFEVDVPASQAVKRARLEAVDGYPVEAACYVACDFETQDFMDCLREAGFDEEAPAFFVWEGVAYYLPEPAVRATLDRILDCHPDSRVVFDMFTERLVEASKDPAQRARLGLFAEVGEPLRFGLDRPLPYLYDLGFRYVETVGFDQLCLNLLGDYVSHFRFQTLTLAGLRAP